MQSCVLYFMNKETGSFVTAESSHWMEYSLKNQDGIFIMTTVLIIEYLSYLDLPSLLVI